MKFLQNIKAYLNRVFRRHYENRISLPYGISRFIGNVAFVQLNANEFIELAPLHYVVELTVTVSGMRPHVKYKVFLKDQNEWFPVEVIVEQRGFNLKNKVYDATMWDIVDINHPKISPLKDLFLSFAFYASLRADHKKKLEGK